jgi:hypothetical protein
MCVVALCDEDKRLTEAQIEDMYDANSHGAGIAWRDKKGRKTVVKWAKGLDLDQMKALALTLPLPYVAHFRIPTCGPTQGIYAPLCHPFPITDGVELHEEGEFDGYLLFHNGQWFDWEAKLLDYACKGNWKLPEGKWSDSRAMAKMAHHLGLGVLDFFKQKICLFSPDKIFLVGDGWIYPQEASVPLGICVSNVGWRDRGNWRRTRQGHSNKPSSTEKEGHTSAQSVTEVKQPGCSPREAVQQNGPAGNAQEKAIGSQTTTTTPIGPCQETSLDSSQGLGNPYRQLARIPKDAIVKAGSGGTLQVTPFVRGKQGMRDPSNPAFEIEVTDQIFHIARLLSSRVDSRGERLLSKSRMKKIEFANQSWREKRQKEREGLLKAAQQRVEEGMAKIPMLH